LLLSLPFLLVAITLQRVWSSPSLLALYVILGVLSWTTLARVTRTKTMQVRALDYVQAARALGMSEGEIVFRHILPNVLGPVIVIGTTLVANMVIAESAMSYLGLGVQPPQASWGSMLLDGQRLFEREPRVLMLPATLIVATVFGFNLLGDGLRDALDPKS
jgi:ABC-type dipeptide/oligopeptide/nickel transport system permease subunit